MSETVIASVDEITAAWLTHVLRTRGYLLRGEVASVHQAKQFTTFTSTIVHIEVCYTDDAELPASSRLLMKMTHPDLSPESTRETVKREIAFYRAILANNAYDLPVPRCYDVAFSPELGKFHLLLDDLSQTHHIPHEWPVPPPVSQCQLVIDSLAKLHARWWGITGFGEDILPPWQGDERDSEYIRGAEKRLADFADYMGDNLTAQRLHYYEYALAKMPALFARRYRGSKNLTLVHGDTHLWNYMYPRDSQRDQVLMIDWQSAYVALAASDLAYMITVHWYPERRARLEQPLLRRYYEQLIAHGVANYSWDDFWYDYRLEFIGLIFNAVWQWSVDLPAYIWWNHFERNVMAFEDLHCMELLQ